MLIIRNASAGYIAHIKVGVYQRLSEKPLLFFNLKSIKMGTFNSPKVCGMSLLKRRFPSLTQRQRTQLYNKCKENDLSIPRIKHVDFLDPMAPVGEDMGVTITF